MGYTLALEQEVSFSIFYWNFVAVVSPQPEPFHPISLCFPALYPHLSSQGVTEVTSLFSFDTLALSSNVKSTIFFPPLGANL